MFAPAVMRVHAGCMRCDLGVPNLTIWYTLSRRGAQCAPEQRKIERFVGEQCSPPAVMRVHAGCMRRDLGVPNLTIWYTLSRRGAQCAPEQRKIERFLGEQCSPLRLRVCMRVACGAPRSAPSTECTAGYHDANEQQPPAKSRLPQEDTARKENENGYARDPV